MIWQKTVAVPRMMMVVLITEALNAREAARGGKKVRA